LGDHGVELWVVDETVRDEGPKALDLVPFAEFGKMKNLIFQFGGAFDHCCPLLRFPGEGWTALGQGLAPSVKHIITKKTHWQSKTRPAPKYFGFFSLLFQKNP
jgi:hypothetical protein